MRVHALVALALFASTTASAKEVFLTIAGSAGNFRTDARIFNPSPTKDILVLATYLPAGTDGNHPNNSGAQAKTITIPRRAMAVYDDVVTSLFQASGLGGIRLQSDDDFLATQRIYADETAGTLGQFIIAQPASNAVTRGVLMQLKSSGTGGKGSFRTNVGFLNPNANAVDVTLRLHDALNNVVATKSMRMQPLGVVQPLNVNGFFNAPGVNLANFFVTFEASHPIFGYGSVIDNGSVDPTYVPGQPDSGANAPQPAVRTFDVTLRNGAIIFTPAVDVALGDRVVLRIRAEATHGFALVGPDGGTVIQGQFYSPGQPAVEHAFKADKAGVYSYYCTYYYCTGHSSMQGSFTVGNSAGQPAAATAPTTHVHHHH